MHAIAHWGCTDTVRESALKVDWEKNPLPHRGIEPASAACRSDALPTELTPPPPTHTHTHIYLCNLIYLVRWLDEISADLYRHVSLKFKHVIYTVKNLCAVEE